MITFDFVCEAGHRFEGWFKSREEFERQLEAGLLSCPLCDSRKVTRRPSAFHVAKGGEAQPADAAPAGATRPAALSFLRELNDFVEKNFEDMGADFAGEALRMKAGEAPARSIRGTTTPDEEETLVEEGVEFLKIPLPKYDA